MRCQYCGSDEHPSHQCSDIPPPMETEAAPSTLQVTRQKLARLSMHVELIAVLEELHAMVRGECPSLLNEDSGGNAQLDLKITELLQKAKQT
jgi:hypothetical protein